MAFSSSNSSAHSEMNVTPLIDVLLVLLIIFMVITPTTPHGLQSQLPQGAAKPSEDVAPQPLVVELAGTDAAPVYRLNSQSVSQEALGGMLRAALASRQERVVFVRGARELSFAPVASLVAAVRAAGATTIALDDAKRPVG